MCQDQFWGVFCQQRDSDDGLNSLPLTAEGEVVEVVSFVHGKNTFELLKLLLKFTNQCNKYF